MAKQRYISTSIWDDDWFVEELTKQEKLFYFYLLTNEHTNIAGIYKISVRRIAQESGFAKKEILSILKHFEKSKKVYYRQEYLIMPNWPKHQKWETSAPIHKGLRAILIREVPNSVLEAIATDGIPYLYPIDTLSKGIQWVEVSYQYPSIHKDLDSDLDSDLDLNNNTKEMVTSAEATIYQSINKAFLSQNGDKFTNYKKEGSAIKGIIKKSKDRQPVDTELFTKDMIARFWELKSSKDKFWSSQPFLPSSLNATGIWDRILETFRESSEEMTEEEFNRLADQAVQ